MKTALILGVTGQDGAFLARLLLGKGYRVVGVTRDLTTARLENLKSIHILERIELSAFCRTGGNEIADFVSEIGPDEIYNLAAQSSVGKSIVEPVETMQANCITPACWFEALRLTKCQARVFQASSGEMFGVVADDDLPATERTPLHPVGPYGISKASAHWTAEYYRNACGLYISCGILFNHESVLRPLQYVTKKILQTALSIKDGTAKELVLGNTGIERDWGYAPDYVEAMWLALQPDKPDSYIISSGESHGLDDFVDTVFRKLDLDPEKFVRSDPALFRPADIQRQMGDNRKARSVLGWEYEYTFSQFIDKLLEDELEFRKSALHG